MPIPPTRRDFLFPATASVAAVTFGAALWGLGRTMSPAAGTVPTLTVDLTGLAPGAEVTVNFLPKPVLIRHRTPQDIAAARAEDATTLPDPLARNLNLAPDAPATDQNRRATPDGRFLVISQICTHLGCVVLGDASGSFDGFFCPCHSGHFDKSGRVRRGPPMQNLPIPPLEWQAPGILTLFPPSAISKARLNRL